MIRSLTAVLARDLRPSDVAAGVLIDGRTGELSAEILDHEVPVAAGTAVTVAETTIEIGVKQRPFRLLVGPSTGPGAVPRVPDEGLRWVPVVVVGEAGRDLVHAGARRAGHDPRIRVLADEEPGLAADMLGVVSSGADVIIVLGGGPRTIELARILGGRPVVAAPLPDPDSIRAMLEDCRVEVDVPVPALEEPERERTWELMRTLGLDRTHHLVEVDPRPAFAGLEIDPRTAALVDRSAAAAGVLAGRLAAANRRWRTAID